MNKKMRVISMVAALSVGISLLGGCAKQKASTGGVNDDEFKEYLKTASYPIETDKTLKAWSYRGGTTYGNWEADELPYLKSWEEKTGIKVDWTFATGDVKQQFNLLIASGDLPDIISYMWGVSADFPGGPEKAIAECYIAPLDDLLADYAPAFSDYLKDNETAQLELKTDSHNYYYIPNYVTSKEANGGVSNGYVFRKDWLDELNLSVPETIDEWYSTLKAFKEQKGASAPFTLQYANLGRGIANPYGISLGLYRNGDTVKYGYAEEGYREFLTEMNKWYREGLLDSNIATVDSNAIVANMLNGKSGAAHFWQSSMRNTIIAGQEKESDFDLVGVPFPVKNKGDVPQFGTRDAMVYYAGFAVSQNSENKELAVKLLDYGFTKEGRELMQFGKEGETYEIKDGKYTFTDLILNNPDGYSSSEATSIYIRNTENIPLLQGYDGLDAAYEKKDSVESVNEALKTWANNDPSDVTVSLSLAPRADVVSEYSKLQTDLSAYVSEMFLKFIVGEEPLENFDSYLAELNKRGLERYMEIVQECYDRYAQR